MQVSYPRKLHRLEGQPILHLDGTADQTIVERLLGPCTFKRWEAERHAAVYQVVTRANGKTGLLADRERLASYERFTGRLAGRSFLCAQKEIRCTITGENTTARLPAVGGFNGCDVIHFGGERGSNALKDHDNAVIVGRMQPPPFAVEGYRGLFWDDPIPLNLPGEYAYEPRGFPDGRGVAVQVHPESRLQSFLEQSREAGVVQALDRLRAVQPAGGPRAAFIFCNLPLPLPPTRLIEEADLLPEWWTLAEDAGGVLPDSPAMLAKLLPGRFGSPQAAKDWLRHGGATVPWQLVELPGKAYYRATPPTAIAINPPLAALTFRARPLRRARAPRRYSALSVRDPLTTFTLIRTNLMTKPTEAAIRMPGFDVMIRDATPEEAEIARHTAARFAAHEAGTAIQADLTASALVILELERSTLEALPPAKRAAALRKLASAPPAARAALLAEFQAEAARAELRAGPMSSAEAARISREAAEQAEELVRLLQVA